MNAGTGPITPLLQDWQGGETGALEALMERSLAHLRGLARMYMARERPDHTLQPTALINEMYLRLERHASGEIQDRAAFFACAARLMRQILVDHARGRSAAKRGGRAQRQDLAAAAPGLAGEGPDPDLVLAVDQGLDRLERIDPCQRRIVELRYFVGLSVEEIALVLGISRASVERRWQSARYWLARSMGSPPE